MFRFCPQPPAACGLRSCLRLLPLRYLLLLLPPLLDLQLDVLQPPPALCPQCHQVLDGQLAQVCRLVPEHRAFVAAPTHATGHASHFPAASVGWDQGLLLVLMLVMVVLLRLLVPLLLALVATEGLRGQTRGAVDGGLGAPMLLVVIDVEVLLQVLGPHAPWAHCHLLQELHCRQKKNKNKREHVYPHIVPANKIVTRRSLRRVQVYPLNVPGNKCVPTYCTR